MQNRKQDDVMREKEWYRERIIEMVKRVDDSWVLKQIYRCIKSLTK